MVRRRLLNLKYGRISVVILPLFVLCCSVRKRTHSLFQRTKDSLAQCYALHDAITRRTLIFQLLYSHRNGTEPILREGLACQHTPRERPSNKATEAADLDDDRWQSSLHRPKCAGQNTFRYNHITSFSKYISRDSSRGHIAEKEGRGHTRGIV